MSNTIREGSTIHPNQAAQYAICQTSPTDDINSILTTSQTKCDSFENTLEIDNYNNYTSAGMILPNHGMSSADESVDAIVSEKSALDALYEKLINNESLLNFYSYKMNHDMAGFSSAFENQLPDEFRDDYIEFCHQYIREADQDTVKLYYQYTLMTRGIRDREDAIWAWELSGMSGVKDDYQDYDIDDILENGNEYAKAYLRHAVCTMLWDKARSSEGLTEQERLFSPHAARLELTMGPRGTFENKMASMADKVNKQLKEGQQSISQDRTFSISFDSNFNFVVTSDDVLESGLLQATLSRTKGALSYIMWCIQYHRKENEEFTPRENSDSSLATIPDNYKKQMELFIAAYEKKQMNERLNRLFGITMDDMEFSGGKLIGKTAEVQKAIESELFREMDYERYIKGMINKETTDDFDFIEIEYTDGNFSLNYK